MHLFWDDFLTKLLVMKKYAVPVICVLLAIISFMLSDNVASFENQDGSIRWSEVIITVISALGLLITFLNVIVFNASETIAKALFTKAPKNLVPNWVGWFSVALLIGALVKTFCG